MFPIANIYSCSGKHLFHIQTHLATTKVNNLNHMHTYTFINTQYCVKEVKTPLINGRIYELRSLFIMRFMQILLLSV